MYKVKRFSFYGISRKFMKSVGGNIRNFRRSATSLDKAINAGRISNQNFNTSVSKLVAESNSQVNRALDTAMSPLVSKSRYDQVTRAIKGRNKRISKVVDRGNYLLTKYRSNHISNLDK